MSCGPEDVRIPVPSFFPGPQGSGRLRRGEEAVGSDIGAISKILAEAQTQLPISTDPSSSAGGARWLAVQRSGCCGLISNKALACLESTEFLLSLEIQTLSKMLCTAGRKAGCGKCVYLAPLFGALWESKRLSCVFYSFKRAGDAVPLPE